MLVDNIEQFDSEDAVVEGIKIEKIVVMSGTIKTGLNFGKWKSHIKCAISNVIISLGQAASDNIILTLKKNGSAIVTATLTSRVLLPAASFSDIYIEKSDLLSFDITQIGTTTAGTDLTIQFNCVTG